MGKACSAFECNINAWLLKNSKISLRVQSWPFKARDCACARAPPHTPCLVEVHDKYAPSKMFTLLSAPGNRTVCKKEELFCFLFLNNPIK